MAGEEGADAHHDVVEADGREADMIEKLDMASTEEQGVKDVANSLPAKLNICMMTQKLLMMFLVLSPSPRSSACTWSPTSCMGLVRQPT